MTGGKSSQHVQVVTIALDRVIGKATHDTKLVEVRVNQERTQRGSLAPCAPAGAASLLNVPDAFLFHSLPTSGGRSDRHRLFRRL